MSHGHSPPPPASGEDLAALHAEVAAMRKQLNAIGDALVYLAGRADPAASPDYGQMKWWPIWKELERTKL